MIDFTVGELTYLS